MGKCGLLYLFISFLSSCFVVDAVCSENAKNTEPKGSTPKKIVNISANGDVSVKSKHMNDESFSVMKQSKDVNNKAKTDRAFKSSGLEVLD